MLNRTDLIDHLDELLAAVKRTCSEIGLSIIEGWVEEGRGVTAVHWNTDDNDSWRLFLTKAKELGASFVVLFAQRLTDEQWNADWEEAQEHGDEDRLQQLEGVKPHIGHVAVVELKSFATNLPGVVVEWNRKAPWVDDFYGTGEDVDGTSAGPRASRLSESEVDHLAAELAANAEFQRVALDTDKAEAVAKRLLPTKAVNADWGLYAVLRTAVNLVRERMEEAPEVRRLADQLARDPKFQRAKNAKQRRYAAEQVLGPEIAHHPTILSLVIERATTVYDIDIREGRSPAH